jgi:peptidoglycan hydrolase CwlO-like protein
MLQERLYTFDRQVSALQQQVDTLQAIRDAQGAEIEKLQGMLKEGRERGSDSEKASERDRPASAEARWERSGLERKLVRLRESHQRLQEK